MPPPCGSPWILGERGRQVNALGSIEWTIEALAALGSVALVAAVAFGLGRRSVGRVASGSSELVSKVETRPPAGAQSAPYTQLSGSLAAGG